MPLEEEDVTGHPRPERDIEAAYHFISREMVTRPMEMGADGTPAMLHYTVIRDALRELLSMRRVRVLSGRTMCGCAAFEGPHMAQPGCSSMTLIVPKDHK